MNVRCVFHERSGEFLSLLLSICGCLNLGLLRMILRNEDRVQGTGSMMIPGTSFLLANSFFFMRQINELVIFFVLSCRNPFIKKVLAK